MSFVIEPTTPVGSIARFFPDAIGIFESLDIDYGCFGNRRLADAAAAAGADLEEAMALLSSWWPEAEAMTNGLATARGREIVGS